MEVFHRGSVVIHSGIGRLRCIGLRAFTIRALRISLIFCGILDIAEFHVIDNDGFHIINIDQAVIRICNLISIHVADTVFVILHQLLSGIDMNHIFRSIPEADHQRFDIINPRRKVSTVGIMLAKKFHIFSINADTDGRQVNIAVCKTNRWALKPILM